LTGLPRPSRDRFQPLRSGLLNLYRYDDQEFWFEDGRLLLRGNNGTGKSRVLALQLPFLFDGEVAPHRMEPDGDPAKRVEWNLLMGGRHPDRLGYTWLELGRRAPDVPGGEEFVTIGCGLSAAAGRGLVNRWFFVTRQRIGQDLFLVAPAGHALSRERLSEAIGEAGAVYTTAAQYREAVDGALFHLGRYRYEALVNLLVQLRQPQLSRQLDEERLSQALSEALPPPSPQMVADVAEAFRGLEADEEALAGFRAASGAVEQFLAEYRRYARIATRRRATAVRTRHSAYEAAMRRLRETERELLEAQAAGAALAAEIDQARIDEEAAVATVEALVASPAMQDAQALRGAREAAQRAAGEVTRGAEDAARRADASRRRAEELTEARASAEAATQEVGAVSERLANAASGAGIGGRHAAIATAFFADPAADLAALRRALEALLEERRRALRRLRALGEDLRRADSALEAAEASAGELGLEVEEAARAQQDAGAAREEAVRGLVEAYRAWVARCRAVAPPTAEAIVDALVTWADEPSGRGPIAVAVSTSLATALEGLAAERASAAARLREVRDRLRSWREERDRLASGAHRPPPPPPTRDEEGRRSRPGAPLWGLVDFADEVPAEARAGLEAALEAAGILDAWVTPDGRVLDPGEHDVLVLAHGLALPEGSHLGAALVPAVDRRDPRAAVVSDETVAAVLARIGLGDSCGAATWVDFEGRFGVGPLDGRYGKDLPEHIGAGSRAAARRRRLEELAVGIQREEEYERLVIGELSALEARRSTAQQEAKAAPDDQAVRSAAAELEARGRALHTSRVRSAEAQKRVLGARATRDSRGLARAEAAADLGLPGIGDDLSGLEDAISRYGAELSAFAPALGRRREAARLSSEASRRADEAHADAATAAARVVELRTIAAAREAEREVLETSVGAAAEDILARYGEAQGRLKGLRAAREARAARERQSIERVVAARGDRERAEGALAVEERERELAASSLSRLAGTRLLGVAVPALASESPGDWSVTRTVDVARTVEGALDQVDASDAAWARSGKGLFAHVQGLEQVLLPYGHQATTTLTDELVVVEVPFQGRVHSMAEFGEILAAEVANRQMLLSAREREVLENHLVGEVSMHLHERLHAAERLVREMNEELSARPMSTGMMLRFSWKAIEDGPPGLPEARRRLMRAGGTWSPAEREALGTFLSKRIDDVRAAELGGTWQDHLAEALDYRSWHHFGVERFQDGVWKPLTRRTHGTGSGGEKAVALTLPQFAAAAAHYRSADPKAPRLILLDEVFVGVDSDMRSKCMGLLATFDLDFVMTSEREWGCYSTLPGLAIYQLATRADVDAVGVTRFVWNGRERLRADAAAPGMRPPGTTDASDEDVPELPLSGEAPP
jgi:uncharacterized protein (TIGR02680 family)